MTWDVHGDTVKEGPMPPDVLSRGYQVRLLTYSMISKKVTRKTVRDLLYLWMIIWFQMEVDCKSSFC